MISEPITRTFERENRDNQEIEVRTNGNPWFKASDMTKVLRINNTTNAVRRLADDEKMKAETEIPAGKHGTRIASVWYVNEPGAYRLVFQSTSDYAEAFKRWLAHDVLPEMRQTGSYQRQVTREDLPKKVIVRRENGPDLTHVITESEVYTPVKEVFQAAGYENPIKPDLNNGLYVSSDHLPVHTNGYDNWVNESGLREWMNKSTAKNAGFIHEYTDTLEGLRPTSDVRVVVDTTDDTSEDTAEDASEEAIESTSGSSEDGEQSDAPAFWSWDDERIRETIRDLVNGNLNNYARIYTRMEIRHGIDVDEDLPGGGNSYLKAMSPRQLRVALHVADQLLT